MLTYLSKEFIMNWQDHFAQRVDNIKPSTIREILKLTRQPNMISFAGGLPAPSLFPSQRIKEATDTVLAKQADKALQYGTTEGYLPLREWIGKSSNHKAENVQIVSGSQQGLDLIAKIFLNKNDKVVVASPTYMGALRAFDVYEVDYLSVKCDDDGMLPESLEHALKQKPKIVYVIPNFDNPSGTTMSLERRQLLVDLARKYNVPIIEDNPYGELRFRGEYLPNLLELAPERVIYSSTFSKIMAPGFRLAWLLAPAEVLLPINMAKQASDLHTSSFTQMIVYEVTKDNFMSEQISKVRAYYKIQNEAMLAALDRYFPTEISWTRPEGGMFLWLTLPTHLDATALIKEAVAKKVAYVPGEAFFANKSAKNTLRLSYSIASLEQIDSGIKSLSEVFKDSLAKAS